MGRSITLSLCFRYGIIKGWIKNIGMETRKLGRHLALAIAAMALIYGWFALVGITDLGNFNHGIRNVLIGVVLVFLSECLTGRSLLHPSWRPGLLIFISGWEHFHILARVLAELGGLE